MPAAGNAPRQPRKRKGKAGEDPAQKAPKKPAPLEQPPVAAESEAHLMRVLHDVAHAAPVGPPVINATCSEHRAPAPPWRAAAAAAPAPAPVSASDEWLVEATTCWPAPYKRAFSSLVSILEEMYVTFDARGLSVEYAEATNNARTFMVFKPEQFERFTAPARITRGVEAHTFYEHIQGAGGNNCVLTIGVPRAKPDVIRVRITDNSLQSTEENDMATFTPDVELPPELTNFRDSPAANVICMNSRDLREKVMKAMLGSKAEHVEIAVTAEGVRFTAQGETGSKSKFLTRSPVTRMLFHEPVTHTFPLVYLKEFTKPTHPGDKVFIHIGRDQPLLLCFLIFKFGELWFSLAPERRTVLTAPV